MFRSRIRPNWIFILPAILVLGCAARMNENLSNDIAANDIRSYIRYLASPELAGRRAGTAGNRKAAEFIKGHFNDAGLEPAGDNGSYYQEFDFVDSIKAGSDNTMSASVEGNRTIQFQLNTEYSPLGFTTDTAISAPVVFVGYGITAPDSLNYDDYAGLDVKGKFVAMLRSTPDGSTTTSRYHRYASYQSKSLTARQHGAAGMILLNSPLDSIGNDAFIHMKYDRGFGTAGIAAASMSINAFNSLLPSGQPLESLQQGINTTKKPASFEIPHCSLTLHTQIVRIKTHTANVAGFLPGNDPALKEQILVIGAHFDHLGMGGEGSLKPDTVAIHPGADDNASGTAGVLELAHYFSAHRAMLKRSILFLSFTGEELGLLGSDWFVNHPTKPLDKMVGMINMDMIGRLRDSTLIIWGVGTGSGFEALVRKENSDSTFKLKLKQDGFGPSDQSSFVSKQMPVLCYFTDVHDDYHKPSDTWDKINYPGEESILHYVARTATDIDTQAAKPEYKQVAAATTERGEFRVTLGIVPDMASDLEGLKISGVRPGGAAEAAGLKPNDIIIKFGDSDVKNIYDYTNLLGKYKPGDSVKVIVKRGNEQVTVTATFKKK